MADINHISFQLLLKSHGGNVQKAQAAWEEICSLGGFGAVPPSYTGGLDIKGLMHGEKGMISEDNFKRIQDLTSGDKPKK